MSRSALQVMMILTTIIASSGTARSEYWAGTVKTVAFKTVEGQPLELDIYYPATKIEEPDPAHIFIHGGGCSPIFRASIKECTSGTTMLARR